MRLQKLHIILLGAMTFLSCKQSEESLFNQAVALDKSGKYRDAINTYSQVLKRNPKNEMALYNRAICWYELDSNKRALDDLTLLIDTKPNTGFESRTNPLWDKSNNRWAVFTSEAVFQRGVILYNIDSLKKAFSDFSACVQNGNEQGESYLYMGSIMVMYGKKDKACEYYRLALSYGSAKAMDFVSKGCP
ncbi:MAG: tetratricopeptide repeat protein [Sphingobacteriales bacterium]|nr:MAG: tetratricopeptide repeat protein [Sphingobacteriales bacterium]